MIMFNQLSTMLSFDNVTSFQKLIWEYYTHHGRYFSWRHSDDPYHIVVSEIMLQQTQTNRVIDKYEQFLIHFPTIKSLSEATLKNVLTQWQGLGYNRRGMYLHRLAQDIMQKYDGIIPKDPIILEQLPGIGYATARSICAFAFNMPTIFIETNIRAVYLHTFFPQSNSVDDKQLMPLIKQTIDTSNPREWYYALMDYGVMLKKVFKNPSRKSKHHTIQSKFDGSDRQIRGQIIRLLIKEPINKELLILRLNNDTQNINTILNKMINEKIIQESNNIIMLPE